MTEQPGRDRSEQRAGDPSFIWLSLVALFTAGLATYAFVLRGENARLRAQVAAMLRDAHEGAAAPNTIAPPSAYGSFERFAESLRASTATDKRLWVASAPAQIGARRQLAEAARRAGWTVFERDVRFPVRAGTFLFGADDEAPPTVAAVQAALEAGSFGATLGFGYRAFYAEKKRDTPSWNGFELAADQSHVVVLGPPPTAAIVRDQ